MIRRIIFIQPSRCAALTPRRTRQVEWGISGNSNDCYAEAHIDGLATEYDLNGNVVSNEGDDVDTGWSYQWDFSDGNGDYQMSLQGRDNEFGASYRYTRRKLSKQLDIAKAYEQATMKKANEKKANDKKQEKKKKDE
jgi:hypothetical protein